MRRRSSGLPVWAFLVAAIPILSGGVLGLGGNPAAAQERAEAAESWTALMEVGNTRYQENDFSGALEAYQEIVDAGLESKDLYYNLGNVHFKLGALGSSILNYERALRLAPGDPDVRANLELVRSLTADEIEPLPRFWILSVASWWTDLLPRRVLILIVILSYVLAASGLCARILSRRAAPARIGTWFLAGGSVGLLLFGTTLLGKERVLGRTDWGIVMAEEIPVRSAPAAEDDFTLFRVHEGTKVRLDQQTDLWSEIVLEDGRVGWVPSEVLEII
ncbi:MAG: tetratricopeptide repeat protein [Gemmatimonadota bacterium]|jgi:tetratricopeptide (TPR) repeat protein